MSTPGKLVRPLNAALSGKAPPTSPFLSPLPNKPKQQKIFNIAAGIDDGQDMDFAAGYAAENVPGGGMTSSR
jgi:hypothetical protein